MLTLALKALVITLGLVGPAMAQERILISSDWGKVTAELVDNDATRSLVGMLPITIDMRDHSAAGKDRQSAFGIARSRATTRFFDRYPGTLELQSLRDLLSRRPRPSAWNYHTRQSDR